MSGATRKCFPWHLRRPLDTPFAAGSCADTDESVDVYVSTLSVSHRIWSEFADEAEVWDDAPSVENTEEDEEEAEEAIDEA